MLNKVTIDEWSSLGRRKGFSAISTVKKKLTIGPPSVDNEISLVNKFIESFDRKFIAYKPKPDEVVKTYTNLTYIVSNMCSSATLACLNEDVGWERKWQEYTWMSIKLVELELEFARFAKKRAKEDQSLSFNPPSYLKEIGLYLGNCMRVGWTCEAQQIGRLYNEIDSIDGVFDTRSNFHSVGSQALITALVLESSDYQLDQGLKEHFVQDELLLWFYEQWQTDDLQLLGHNLQLLCDRHTHQARNTTNEHSYEYWIVEKFYDVAEVLTILRLRKQAELESVVVDHSLMKTPLGRLFELEVIAKVDNYGMAFDECLKYFRKVNR